jgi:hypothetical protein
MGTKNKKKQVIHYTLSIRRDTARARNRWYGETPKRGTPYALKRY